VVTLVTLVTLNEISTLEVRFCHHLFFVTSDKCPWRHCSLLYVDFTPHTPLSVKS